LVELVVAYLSSVRLTWSQLDPVAHVLSRIVRSVVTTDSKPRQRRELLARLESMGGRMDSPTLITAQLHAEWSIVANPLLIFMERCATAYCARSSAAIWKCFDDSELPALAALQRYLMAAAHGDAVQVDRIVYGIYARVRALRNGGTISATLETHAVSA
jgi:hypothetical protein